MNEFVLEKHSHIPELLSGTFVGWWYRNSHWPKGWNSPGSSVWFGRVETIEGSAGKGVDLPSRVTFEPYLLDLASGLAENLTAWYVPFPLFNVSFSAPPKQKRFPE